ncbi:MAG: hypothetical protein FJ301_11425 [Planctomycetes bacterium]|nr:hypothetical protein [Planctomycetota bacterium]
MQALASAILAVAAVTATLPAQQLALARNDNLSYAGQAVGWPASTLAFRFTANVAQYAAAQVFTGNQPPAAHTLEIRTRNPVTGAPDQLVGQPGTWQTLHPRSWQGATFVQPANVTIGQDYFLVWRVTGMFHQHSVSHPTEPTNVHLEVQVSDGVNWFNVSQLPGKFRLFGSYAAGTTATYGTGKPGQYGVPTIALSGWPAVGSPIDVLLDGASRLTPAILVIGTPIPTGAPLGWVTVWATPDALVSLTTRAQSNPISGGYDYTFFVPNTPAAIGFPLSFQYGIFDPQAADGFSHTGGATAVIN